MKSADLKKGMKVKWLASPFDKHYTRGVFEAFGGTVHRAWVRTSGGRGIIPTRELLRPWQKYKPSARRVARARRAQCEVAQCFRSAIGYGQGHLLCNVHAVVDTPLAFKTFVGFASSPGLPPLCIEPKCGVPCGVGKVWCEVHMPVASGKPEQPAFVCTMFERADPTTEGNEALDACLCGHLLRTHRDFDTQMIGACRTNTCRHLRGEMPPLIVPVPYTTKPDTQVEIAALCDEVKEMLLAKNRAYGDSALDPVRIFSKATPVEQILVRLDDKLSRLSRGSAAGEDVINDLIGYLVLLKIAMKRSVEKT